MCVCVCVCVCACVCERESLSTATSSPLAQVRAEELGHCKKALKLTCNGVGLDKKDLFGKSDPYLELARENPDGTFSVVYKTIVRLYASNT